MIRVLIHLLLVFGLAAHCAAQDRIDETIVRSWMEDGRLVQEVRVQRLYLTSIPAVNCIDSCPWTPYMERRIYAVKDGSVVLEKRLVMRQRVIRQQETETAWEEIPSQRETAK